MITRKQRKRGTDEIVLFETEDNEISDGIWVKFRQMESVRSVIWFWLRVGWCRIIMIIKFNF